MKLSAWKGSLLLTGIFLLYLLLGAGVFYAIEKDAEEPVDITAMFMLKVAGEKQMKAIQTGMSKAVPQVAQAYKAQTGKDSFDEADVSKITQMSLEKVKTMIERKMAQASGETLKSQPEARKHSANGESEAENLSENNPSYESYSDVEARQKRQAQNETELETTPQPVAATTAAADEDSDHMRKASFGSYLYLCMTIMSTIGYGHEYPKTTAGRVFFLFYSALGIPLFFFTIWALACAYRRLVIFVHTKILQALQKESMNSFLKNITRFLIVFVLGFFVLVLMCAVLFQHVEGWTYLEAVYMEFATLLTVGFGDLYPGVMMGLGDPREVSRAIRGIYILFVLCYIVFGIAWVFSLVLMAFDCCRSKHQTKEISRSNGVSTPPKVAVGQDVERIEEEEKPEQGLLSESEKPEEKEMEEIKPDNQAEAV